MQTINKQDSLQIVIEDDVAIMRPRQQLFKSRVSLYRKNPQPQHQNQIQRQPTTEELHNTTIALLRERLIDISISMETIHLLIKNIMELTEETPIKGPAQREFALKIMKEILTGLSEDHEERNLLIQLLDNGTIGNMIDLIVDASRGNLKINMDTNTTIDTTITCCLTLLLNRMKKKPKPI